MWAILRPGSTLLSFRRDYIVGMNSEKAKRITATIPIAKATAFTTFRHRFATMGTESALP